VFEVNSDFRWRKDFVVGSPSSLKSFEIKIWPKNDELD